MKDPFPQNDTQESQYRIAELEKHSRRQTMAMATSLVSLIDLRDRYTGRHSQRVAKYVRGIGMQMCLPDDQIETIVFAASLHDIGKIGVPDHILLKPGFLSDDEEFAWIRKHSEWGWIVVRSVDGFQQTAQIILHHHERFDGAGYPSRLRGNEIPLGARMIAVADSYDALTTNRPYRTARTRAEALNELSRCGNTQFDPQVLNAFVAYLERTQVFEKGMTFSA